MARKNDDMALQTRALVKDFNGERMAFVQHDSGLFALPGVKIEFARVKNSQQFRVFAQRFTTLEKIKLWAKQNKFSVEVDDAYPVYYSVSENMKHSGVAR